ncbi:hypothetical protein [Aquamicrobium sp. LC103]|uniref:hypothetical protein n=1 Tax=Aquamicrobium sp. LC103 TaxID=1120658 RepID=UPI001484E044|nr:hypothetical protein [Aquamicrobium sp. LC103]
MSRKSSPWLAGSEANRVEAGWVSKLAIAIAEANLSQRHVRTGGRLGSGCKPTRSRTDWNGLKTMETQRNMERTKSAEQAFRRRYVHPLQTSRIDVDPTLAAPLKPA